MSHGYNGQYVALQVLRLSLTYLLTATLHATTTSYPVRLLLHSIQYGIFLCLLSCWLATMPVGTLVFLQRHRKPSFHRAGSRPRHVTKHRVTCRVSHEWLRRKIGFGK